VNVPRLSITDIAARVGVHKSTVSRQARANGLVGPDGKVDLAEYQTLRQTSLDPALQTGAAPQAGLSLADVDGPVLAAERALKLAADRERAQIELAARKGELVPAADVASAEEDVWRTVRDKLMGAPRAWAEQLLDVSEAAVMEARLRRSFNALLREIAETLERDEDHAAGRAPQREATGAPSGGPGAQAAA
jgi:AcrR family transcriptional regulator